jgi:hypothetical protein
MGTRQIFIDDLSGTEDGVETVGFGIDGVTYEIDLGSENQERLRTFLDEFVAAARPIARDGRKRPPRGSGNRKAQAHRVIEQEKREGTVTVVAEVPDFDAKLARAWLRKNKFEVPDRGRIRAEVAAPYLESDEFKAWQEKQAAKG